MTTHSRTRRQRKHTKTATHNKVESAQQTASPGTNLIVALPVVQLRLDAANPRFAGRTDADSQKDLVRILWKEFAADEIALSIAENDFFQSEPLFVVREGASYTVVEGNRRLAAVLLLRNRQLRRELGAESLPVLSPAKLRKLDYLPAIVYPDRESLWFMVGFKHIKGAKTWDSFSKAEFIRRVHDNFRVPLKQIAERIGDYHSTVKRLYRGYELLEQAEKQAGFDKEDTARNRFFFSHLYTAADQSEFQHFLGIGAETSLKPNPVRRSRLGELAELMTWLYGKRSTSTEPVVRRQNPDLNTLREVVGNRNALAALRNGRPLTRAHEIAVGDKRLFREALTDAKEDLKDAMSTVTTGYSGEEDLFEVAEDAVSLAGNIREQMYLKFHGEDVEPKSKKRT